MGSKAKKETPRDSIAQFTLLLKASSTGSIQGLFAMVVQGSGRSDQGKKQCRNSAVRVACPGWALLGNCNSTEGGDNCPQRVN